MIEEYLDEEVENDDIIVIYNSSIALLITKTKEYEYNEEDLEVLQVLDPVFMLFFTNRHIIVKKKKNEGSLHRLIVREKTKKVNKNMLKQ